MKNFVKIIAIFFILLFICFILSGCDNNSANNIGNSNNFLDISRTNTTKNISENDNQNDENANFNEAKDNSSKTAKETEISSFYTPLKSGVANRIINIKLTCDKINEKVLQNGESFSFNEIVGPCTAEEGYKEAEIYVNKQIKYALGGGNCQVSTTLYNAVLAIPRN